MSTVSKSAISIAVALVIILGALFYFNRTDSSEGENIKADKIITYNGTAFDPATVEIKVGESVAFVNQSVAGMWVASAPNTQRLSGI